MRALIRTLSAALLLAASGACDQLKDPPGEPPPRTLDEAQMHDIDVTMTVKSALLADPAIQDLAIEVATRKGDVKLTGFVERQSQADHAIALVRSLDGVRSVHNQLSIRE